MDDDGQLHLARHADMHAEQILLHLPVGLVVVIVQPGFPDADHARIVGRGAQAGGTQIGMVVGFVRMDADAGPDVGLPVRGADHTVPLAGAGGDVQKGFDPGGARPIQHGLLIFDQAFVFEMAMAIDQHQVAGSSSGRSSLGNAGVGLSIRCPSATSAPNHPSSARSPYERRLS